MWCPAFFIFGGFMGEGIKQFYNPDDDCVYFFDKKKNCFRKICDIPAFNDLPISIKRQIKAAKEDAVEIIGIPCE